MKRRHVNENGKEKRGEERKTRRRGEIREYV
jgi:hypothetical protein